MTVTARLSTDRDLLRARPFCPLSVRGHGEPRLALESASVASNRRGKEGTMRVARSSGYRSTARGRSRRWRRGVLALATAVGMVAMLAGIALAANPATATLSNGAQLTVSIDSPATGTEFVGSSVDV